MESAGILAAAGELQIPTLAVKIVSDTADTGIPGYWRDFHTNMERLGEYLQLMVRVISTEAASDPAPSTYP
jgi:nucleoside phosphorylase